MSDSLSHTPSIKRGFWYRLQTYNVPVFMMIVALYPLFLGGNRPFPQYLFGCILALNGIVTLYHAPYDILRKKYFILPVLWGMGLLGYLLYSTFFITSSPIFGITKWVLYFSYYMAFVQVMILSNTQGFFHKILKTIFISGVIYSIYGLYALSDMGGDMILFYQKTDYLGDLTSVFINRNHFALYACLVWGVGLYLLGHTAYKTSLFDTARKRTILVKYLNFMVTDGLYIILGLCVVMAALLLTSSRGGVLQILLGTSFICVGALIKYIFKIQKFQIILMTVFIVTGLGGLLSLYGAKTDSRLYYLDDSYQERTDIWNVTKRMIADKPMTGHGISSFEDRFNHYRTTDASLYKRWDKAHNDYLEILAEYGIIYAAAFYGLIVYFVICMIYGIFKKSNYFGCGILSLSLLLMLGVHEIYDFGGQMPAVAVIMITMTTLGYVRIFRI